MTAATTTAPAVKGALYEALKTYLSCEVWRGYPGEASAGEELVIVGRVSSGSTEFRSLRGPGRPPRQEFYTVDIALHVYDPVGEQVEVTERVYGLLAGLEDVLADDPTLGGLCQTAHLASWDDVEAPGPTGCYGLVQAHVAVTARNL